MDWQADACRDGLPLQREAMSEALEELLFDSDVVGARLEMLLPLDGVYWRVLQGVGADVFDSQASSAALKDCLDWPLDPLESYVMATPCADAVLAVGVKRTMLQAWIDVSSKPTCRCNGLIGSSLVPSDASTNSTRIGRAIWPGCSPMAQQCAWSWFATVCLKWIKPLRGRALLRML